MEDFLPDVFTAATDKENAKKILRLRDANFDAEARQVLVDAQADYERMMQDARMQSEEIAQQAYADGFAQGEQAGKKLGIDQLSPYLESFRTLCEELGSTRQELLATMEPEIIRLSLAVAEKVVRQVVEQDRELATRLVRHAVSQLNDQKILTIKVNKADYDLVSELRPEIAAMRGLDSCRIESDPNVAPGGCILETEGGNIDARIDTALAAVQQLAENDDH